MRATINLYEGDCLPAMRKMADNQYSLAICDPPYGIGDFSKVGDADFYKQRSDKKYGKINWNDHGPGQEYFDELYRISTNQIIWGANYFRKYIKDTGVIVWDKNNASSRWSKVEIASNSTSGINNIFKFTWNGFIRDEKTERIHPTQKPVALYKWLLKNYAKEGDNILDTHFGSLSIGIACWDAGYSLDAYEIDLDYFEAGKKRLEVHQAQLQIY